MRQADAGGGRLRLDWKPAAACGIGRGLRRYGHQPAPQSRPSLAASPDGVDQRPGSVRGAPTVKFRVIGGSSWTGQKCPKTRYSRGRTVKKLQVSQRWPAATVSRWWPQSRLPRAPPRGADRRLVCFPDVRKQSLAVRIIEVTSPDQFSPGRPGETPRTICASPAKGYCLLPGMSARIWERKSG